MSEQWKVSCPKCGILLGFEGYDTKVIWAKCKECGHKFTACNTETYDDWIPIGCRKAPRIFGKSR